MKILKVREKTCSELAKIQQELAERDGESKTLDQVVEELIKTWMETTQISRARVIVSKSSDPTPTTIDPRLRENSTIE